MIIVTITITIFNSRSSLHFAHFTPLFQIMLVRNRNSAIFTIFRGGYFRHSSTTFGGWWCKSTTIGNGIGIDIAAKIRQLFGVWRSSITTVKSRSWQCCDLRWSSTSTSVKECHLQWRCRWRLRPESLKALMSLNTLKGQKICPAWLFSPFSSIHQPFGCKC